ncbi:MAG TPA: glycerophosphodiester phosphodiesterase [Candidatus Dormibacteraeota bacterium]|nr:glycerophosphodiester phosphodiesterase [Candidatus Dormibacteraeota bacterium]
MSTTLATPLDVPHLHAGDGLRLTACVWCGSRRHELVETAGGVLRDSCLRCGAEHRRILDTESDVPADAPSAAAVAATRWVAHAGLAASRPGGAPTRETLAEVLRAGVDCVELDVCVTADGALVLRHDSRLSTGRRISTLAMAELRHRGHDLLTLDEATEMVAGRVPLLVDVKSRETATPLATWLRGHRSLDVLGVCSDDREVLVELRRGAPAMPRWWSLPAVPTTSPEWAGAVVEVLAQRRGLRGLVPPLTDLGTLARDRPLCREDLLHLAAIPTRRWLPTQLPRLSADVAPAGVAVAHGAITPALCAAAERLGLLMAAWTVNRAGLARRVMRCGVRIIISDRVVPLRHALSAPPASRPS